MVLYAWSLGIGTTWIGGTMMRKGIGADSRFPSEQILFDGDLDRPIFGGKATELADLIELVRWAPSAVNKQKAQLNVFICIEIPGEW